MCRGQGHREGAKASKRTQLQVLPNCIYTAVWKPDIIIGFIRLYLVLASTSETKQVQLPNRFPNHVFTAWTCPRGQWRLS